MNTEAVHPRVSEYLARPPRPCVSVDIGALNCRLAVVMQKEKLREARVPMDAFTSQAKLVERVAAEIKKLNVETVKLGGVGFPCPTDENGEPTRTPPNVNYSFNGFIGSLSQATGIKFFGFNNGEAGGMGEAVWGAGRYVHVNDMVWHSLGRGFGSAIVRDRQVFRAEFGHNKAVNPLLYPEARLCGCRARGDIEAYVTPPALTEQYYDMTGVRLEGSELGKIISEGCDVYANKIFDDAMSYLAVHIANVHLQVLGGRHVIGGGLANIGSKLLDVLRSKLRQPGVVAWGYDLAPDVVLTELNGNAGLLGLAILAENKAGT
ncbi:MAG: ROK family protein [Candidatus Saganbacteria bacterium]|nr:ROK family protein [Candidatus Saganbacteria bacterium]